MTPSLLYSGARMAVKLARDCDRSASEYDDEWRQKMRDEAKRHRERAATYLKSRALLLRDERRTRLEIAA